MVMHIEKKKKEKKRENQATSIPNTSQYIQKHKPFMGIRNEDCRPTYDAVLNVALLLLVDNYHVVGVNLDGIPDTDIVYLKTIHKHLHRSVHTYTFTNATVKLKWR